MGESAAEESAAEGVRSGGRDSSRIVEPSAGLNNLMLQQQRMIVTALADDGDGGGDNN